MLSILVTHTEVSVKKPVLIFCDNVNFIVGPDNINFGTTFNETVIKWEALIWCTLQWSKSIPYRNKKKKWKRFKQM